MRTRYVVWVVSEEQFRILRAMGWEYEAPEKAWHHVYHAVLLHWTHADDPPPVPNTKPIKVPRMYFYCGRDFVTRRGWIFRLTLYPRPELQRDPGELTPALLHLRVTFRWPISFQWLRPIGFACQSDRKIIRERTKKS